MKISEDEWEWRRKAARLDMRKAMRLAGIPMKKPEDKKKVPKRSRLQEMIDKAEGEG